MKVCLLGLTGFGSVLFRSLLAFVPPGNIVVVTRAEETSHPCFPCDDMFQICQETSVKVFLDREFKDGTLKTFLVRFMPDIICTCTYHLKIPAEILAMARCAAVNIHPSYLPHYRGPMPTNWMIFNGESEGGFSVHAMNQDFDKGDILYQEKVAIGDKNDGQFREEIARRVADRIQAVLDGIESGRFAPMPQRAGEGSFFPKIGSEKGLRILRKSCFLPDRLIRGVTPYPGRDFLEKNGLL